MCIFAVASTIPLLRCLMGVSLWIASKCVSLQWQAQSPIREIKPLTRCELLQNVYLCSGKHNSTSAIVTALMVVNCFKMCIFAVASTIGKSSIGKRTSCELLQNVYLCSGKHNYRAICTHEFSVVNCFKMCIFAVASTIRNKYRSDFQLVILFLCKIKTAI